MVGVPRSRGCLLCVRRRVRCDEGRPGCAKCHVYGVNCPGYDRSLKFVTGKHHVKRKRGATAEADDSSDTSDTSAAAVQTTAAAAVSTPIPPHPRPDRAAYISTIFEMVNTEGPERNKIFYGSWLHHIPDRLGRRATLDSAVCSYAMHLLGKSRADDSLVMQSRHLYGQSLAELQTALNHPTEWRSSETLCSTMVLCLYELFADTSGAATGWVQHSSAVAHLMQQRGPDGFKTPWDQAMLFSFRALIIMNSIFTGTDCFLAKKKWQRILISDLAVVNPAQELPLNIVKVVDRHLAHMARMPSVMRHGWAIREARRHGLPVDIAQVAMLRRSAYHLRSIFVSWFTESKSFLGDPILISVPSSVPDDAPPSPYPVVFTYQNPWMASVYLSYATCMLIIQDCINQCSMAQAESTEAAEAAKAAVVAEASTPEYEDHVQLQLQTTMQMHMQAPSESPSHADSASAIDTLDISPEALPETPGALVPFDASNRVLCRIIYRSFEKVSGGVMGPYRLGFSMRVSYEFADLHTQLWIQSLLRRSAKIYASAKASAYPPPAPNEYNYN